MDFRPARVDIVARTPGADAAGARREARDGLSRRRGHGIGNGRGSKPDGYTILLGTAATHSQCGAEAPGFDVEADFTPIAPLVDVSNVLTVNPEIIDVKSVRNSSTR